MEKKDEEEIVSKKNYTFLNILLLIIIFLVGVILYARYLGVKGLIVKEYRVDSEILTENFSGVKIVHFSDLLYKSTVDKDDIKSLVEKVNILKPDIIVFTGDLVNINTKITSDDNDFLIEEFKSMNATIGKYAIYGDYDYSYDDYSFVMESAGFHVLDNSYEEVYYKSNDYIYIVGLPSSQKSKIDMDKAFKFYSDESRKYTIVITHEGANIKYIDDSTYEVDLILGGHSLNGSVILPFYGSLFVDEASYKYYSPYYSRGITDIYISSGIGTNKYNYRFNNKPSINLYRLKAQS